MHQHRNAIRGSSETFWEQRWAPYDPGTYQAVLELVQPDDIILELGAGDLRLARRLARRSQQVFAIEIQARLLSKARRKGRFPDNLHVICGDARWLPYPKGITVGVLLMRHCTQFPLYQERLRAAGCERLITNARWRMGVEIIDLAATCIPFSQASLGWYACQCGTTGFIPGPPEQIIPARLNVVQNVSGCPACRHADP